MTDRPAPTARERIRLALLDDGWQSHHADRAADALLGGPVAAIVAEALRDAADDAAGLLMYQAARSHLRDRADTIEREGIR